MKYITISISFVLFLCSASAEEPQKDKSKEAEQEKKLKEFKQKMEALYGDQIRISELRHAALDSVDRTKVPYLGEFMKLYPQSIVVYSSYAGGDFPSFDVTATIHDRYELTLRLPVTYNADNSSISKYGEPVFYFLEVREVKLVDDALTTSYEELQFNFKKKKWRVLFEAAGDFSALGYKLKKADPVKNFNLLVKELKLHERIIQKK